MVNTKQYDTEEIIKSRPYKIQKNQQELLMCLLKEDEDLDLDSFVKIERFKVKQHIKKVLYPIREKMRSNKIKANDAEYYFLLGHILALSDYFDIDDNEVNSESGK